MTFDLALAIADYWSSTERLRVWIATEPFPDDIALADAGRHISELEVSILGTAVTTPDDLCLKLVFIRRLVLAEVEDVVAIGRYLDVIEHDVTSVAYGDAQHIRKA
jgi:hypothetical protein